MSAQKIFLLYGASGELGAAAVDYFLTQNYDYHYFISRKNPEINGKIKNYRIISASDLSEEENVVKTFSEVGRIENGEYHLFSTIGGYIGGKTVAETEYSDFIKMLDLNLISAFLIAKYFAQLLKSTLGGSICFTSALSSMKPEANKAAYNLSKNGLNYLVESLAIEGKEMNFRANAIAPFAIDTISNREWIDDSSKLVNPTDICITAKSLFDDKSVTGKIVPLPASL